MDGTATAPAAPAPPGPPQPDDDPAFPAALARDEMIIRRAILDLGTDADFVTTRNYVMEVTEGEIPVPRPTWERLHAELFPTPGQEPAEEGTTATPTATTTTIPTTNATFEIETRPTHMDRTEKYRLRPVDRVFGRPGGTRGGNGNGGAGSPSGGPAD
jgi:hypothetical protein